MKHMNTQIIIALVLILLGSVGGILLVIFQTQSSAKEKEEILNLNKRLLDKSEELNKFLGASDAFPLLIVSSGSSEEGTLGFTFTIKNEFKYPIYDIEINCMDFGKILTKSEIKNGSYHIKRSDFTSSIIFVKDINHLAQNSEIINSELYQYQDNVLYVKLKCRNSFVFEKIAFVTIGKVIHVGFMVYDSEGNILKEWLGHNTSEEVHKRLREKFNIIPKNVSLSFIN